MPDRLARTIGRFSYAAFLLQPKETRMPATTITAPLGCSASQLVANLAHHRVSRLYGHSTHSLGETTMHSLNVIAKLNAAAEAKALGPRQPVTPMLDLLVIACMGVITITGRKLIEGNWVHFEKVVNAANPLLDGPLCDFHRTWDGPKAIAMQVEALASQHRRMISASELWDDCVREANATQPAIAA